MEQEKPIYHGKLLIPASGKILMKKSWHQKYGMLFKSSKFGVDRLEIYEGAYSTKQLNKIINLQDCIKIMPTSPTCFTITTNSALYEFGALSSDFMKEWLTSLQSVCFPDDCSKVTSVEEDNDIYCSSGEGIFNVKLHSSPASTRCGLEAKQYLLVLTNDSVQLRNCHDNKTLFTWPYCFIRRYGYKNGMFTFEAGRKCNSGEGIFYLQHSDQQEIFRCFSSRIKSMKKLLSNETFPALSDMDSSFHSVLSMEARSRSPLPLSPTPFTTVFSNIEESPSTKPQISELTDILTNKFKAISRPIPTKPPRKNIPLKDDDSKQFYEAVNKYDEIEYISEAWKTMGVNDVVHNEVVEPEEEYASWGGIDKKGQNKSNVNLQASKIVLEPQNKEDYDKLNFFGSKNKFSSINSSYKQVKVTSNDSLNPPSFNDYDEIEVMEPLGKSVKCNDKNTKNFIPIKQPLKKSKDAQISHQFQNDEPYAIISKPKQV